MSAKRLKLRKGRRSHSAKCEHCGKEHGDGAPWWNRAKNGWSLTYKKDGRTGNKLLAKSWDGHDEAIRLWKELSVNQTAAGPITLAKMEDGESVTVQWLVNHRLDYLRANASENHYVNSRNWLKEFCQGGFADVTIGEMRNGGIARIKQWVGTKRWNDTTKANFYRCLKALFNYATDKNEDSLSIIALSPIAKLNTGRTRVHGKARVALLSAEQEQAILDNADPRGIYPQVPQAFKVLMATGVRPEEFCSVTAADVRRDASGDRDLYWWIDHKNKKKTGTKRRVYLTPEMQKITQEQLEKHPDGPLFRNCWGQPWDVDNLYGALRRITSRPACVKLGLDDHTLGKRTNGKTKKEYLFVVYTYRHSFSHRHLTGFYNDADGKPIVLNYGEVAELMGNSAAEVERSYGKLVKATTHLSRLVKHA